MGVVIVIVFFFEEVLRDIVKFSVPKSELLYYIYEYEVFVNWTSDWLIGRPIRNKLRIP